MAKSTKSDSETRRDQRRLEHQDLSRNQLLDAAEETFGRKGFHETTLKEVADLAGFSVGSVYSFFESKDDLFRQIFLRRGEQFMSAMDELFAEGAQAAVVASSLNELRELARFQIEFFRATPNFGRVFLRYSSVAMLAAENDQVDDDVSKRFESSMNMQARLFERGQQAGEMCGGDPLVLSRLFSGLISSFQAVDPAVISDEPGDALPIDDFLDLVVRAFSA